MLGPYHAKREICMIKLAMHDCAINSIDFREVNVSSCGKLLDLSSRHGYCNSHLVYYLFSTDVTNYVSM